MTLSIRRLKWLDKEQEWADIDLAAGTACGLPEGTELLQVCREGDRTILLFRQAEGGPDAPFTFLFRDPEGTEHTFDGVTTSGTAEEVDGGSMSSICITSKTVPGIASRSSWHIQRRRTMKT